MFSEMDLNRDKRISLYEFKTAGPVPAEPSPKFV
jgi:hypothetical protein